MAHTPLPDFTKGSLLVVGDVMLDRYWFGDTGRISPEAPVPVVKIKQTDERPGGAGNVALNIAALGARVTLMGIGGKDASAATLIEQLSTTGINTHIQQLDGIPTITKLRVISRHQQLIRLDFEETFPAFDATPLLSAYKKQLENCQLVILSDYDKGTLSDPQAFIQLARAMQVPVLVDPKGSDFSKYQGASIITPNLKEFETVVGTCQTEHDIITRGQALLKTHQIDALLLTRGERGMTLLLQTGDEYHLPAHAREVFDVTGAGDTVIAVLGAAIAAGSTLQEAVKLANLGASLAVAKLGAATVTPPELQASLSQIYNLQGGVVNDEQLLLAVNQARGQGKRIVFTNGCFDILHAGHVNYLQQAKLLGDFLIVATNDDASIARLKGPTRPVNSLNARMSVLAGLGAVDWVVSYEDDTPNRLLTLLQPDVLVKGGDYTSDQVVGAEIVSAYGGDVRVLGLTKGVSTTEIIDRIHNNTTIIN